MKRILVFLLLAVASAFAQQGALTGFAGRVNAVQYGSWSLPIFYGTPAGAGAIIVGGNGRVTLPDGVEFVPFKVGTPIRINDGPNSETVTPTAIGNCGNGKLFNQCTITAVFTKAHGAGAGTTVSSGTAGLQEAINALLSTAGLVVISGSWNGTTSMITTTATGSTAVGVEDLRAGVPNYYGWNGSAYAAVSGGGGGGAAVLLGPLGDQTIVGGFDLINDNGGAFTGADSGQTAATINLLMNSGNPGQGQIAYFNPTGPVSTNIRFNPSGAIVLNSTAGGADDGAHGIVIGNSGVYIAGGFTDGNSLVLTQGNLAIAGGSLATGNPLVTLGSSGVEGVLKTVPSSGGGSYTIRSPATALNNVINLPLRSGTLPSIASTLATSSSVCTDLNSQLTTTSCGSTLFSAIGAGTNTSAAMIVGTGASLTWSGAGTINASSLLSGTWAIPGAIGSTTPNTGAFSLLTAPPVPIVPVGADPTGVSDSFTAIQAAITLAISSGKCVYLPKGTYISSASLIAASNSFCLDAAGASTTSITASGAGYNTLVIGPGSVTYVGPNGHISDITLVGKSRTADGHSALQLSGTVQYDVSRVTVATADIGFDLINNNYGVQFNDVRACFGGTCNVGVNLRTGAQSGSDISFNNPWISGVVAAMYMSGGGGGYHIYGGQLGGGIGIGSPSDTSGTVVMGKDYLSGAVGETTADFHGTSFEGTNDVWVFRTYSQIQLKTFGIYANPSDNVHPAIGFYKGTAMANSRIDIDGTTLSGYWSGAAMLSFAGTNGGFQNWWEKDTYSAAQNPTINSVSTYVFSMAAQSGLLQNAQVIDSNVSRYFRAEQYPTGATIDVQVNACLADALAASGTCDARALVNAPSGGPRLTAAQIVVGDSTGDPVTLLLPSEFYWAGGMTDGTSCTVKQFPNTQIIGHGTPGGNFGIIGAGNSSNLGHVFCFVGTAGGNSPDYFYDFGFNIFNHSGGFFTGHVTATGVGVEFTGPIYDNSTLDHVNMFDDVDTYVFEAYNMCCDTVIKGGNINGNFVTVPVHLLADGSGGQSQVSFVDESIVHNPTNSPLVQLDDTGSHTSVINFTRMYAEVHANAGGIMVFNGGGSISITDSMLKAYTSSMTSPGVVFSNTVDTRIHISNLNLTNGGGSWTQPCTQAIVANFSSITVPCVSISGVGNASFSNDPRVNNVYFQGGLGLGTNAKNFMWGDSTTLNRANFTGQNVTICGAGAGAAMTSSSNDTICGQGAMPGLIGGGSITAFGNSAGNGSVLQTTTQNSSFIGQNTGCGSDGLTNVNVFGIGAICQASNTNVFGNSSITDSYFGSSGSTANSHSNVHGKALITDDTGPFGSNQTQTSAACETSFAPTTLGTGATTTDTGLNCLPANSVIDAVVYRVTTAITTSANFTIGDATTAARFCGTQSTLTLGATGICFVQADQTGAPGPRQAAAAKVRVTLNANPGAGAIRLIVYYHTWTAPTS